MKKLVFLDKTNLNYLVYTCYIIKSKNHSDKYLFIYLADKIYFYLFIVWNIIAQIISYVYDLDRDRITFKKTINHLASINNKLSGEFGLITVNKNFKEAQLIKRCLSKVKLKKKIFTSTEVKITYKQVANNIDASFKLLYQTLELIFVKE